jgi:hypothetical protein
VLSYRAERIDLALRIEPRTVRWTMGSETERSALHNALGASFFAAIDARGRILTARFPQRHPTARALARALLATVAGLSLQEMADCEVCCGFGGTFCVKYPEISNHMVGEKADAVEASGADTLLAGDLGCLINMAGKLARQGSNVRVRHVAEVLADAADGPAIGEAADRPVGKNRI